MNIYEERCGFLYVCGHPGTGKTQLLNEVLEPFVDHDGEEEADQVKVLKMNAMSFLDYEKLIHHIFDYLVETVTCSKEKKLQVGDSFKFPRDDC